MRLPSTAGSPDEVGNSRDGAIERSWAGCPSVRNARDPWFQPAINTHPVADVPSKLRPYLIPGLDDSFSDPRGPEKLSHHGLVMVTALRIPKPPSFQGRQRSFHLRSWGLFFPSVFVPHRNLALIESSFLQVLAGNKKMAIWKDGIAELTALIRTPIIFKPSHHTNNSSTPTRPLPQLISSSHSSNKFGEKALYLESIGIDLFSLIHDYPPILYVPIEGIKSTIDYMTSFGFTIPEFRRIVGMCPELLTYMSSDIIPVFTFLLREANVNGCHLRRVINRRPRLLVSDVDNRLRPTLYFLQRLGITQVHKHTSLLSCSVEDKFIPRIDYLEKIGFSHRDAMYMIRKFPQLLCYSIKFNFEPKFEYFLMEMGRELKELKEFPQYFSFSLDKRIKPRHSLCVHKGVFFPLPVLLRSTDEQFRDRLEVCCNSSLPLSTSPLWRTDYLYDY
ncbi:hypothetical protein GIB67_040004 [Kingdonia uniflora]|uniref:Uncharacterized protein n=1 Tax=Kingdonia uniflora TaxID=39325 RepID=A0A7J7LI27_9MAGN|nr:hypothetical protein GIB67_040004 [Kingdonia uniflora]